MIGKLIFKNINLSLFFLILSLVTMSISRAALKNKTVSKPFSKSWYENFYNPLEDKKNIKVSIKSPEVSASLKSAQHIKKDITFELKLDKNNKVQYNILDLDNEKLQNFLKNKITWFEQLLWPHLTTFAAFDQYEFKLIEGKKTSYEYFINNEKIQNASGKNSENDFDTNSFMGGKGTLRLDQANPNLIEYSNRSGLGTVSALYHYQSHRRSNGKKVLNQIDIIKYEGIYNLKIKISINHKMIKGKFLPYEIKMKLTQLGLKRNNKNLTNVRSFTETYLLDYATCWIAC